MIVGIDAGNSEVKMAGPLGLDKFCAAIGEYQERNLENNHGDGMVWEYEGKKGFAGMLALIESDFGGSIMGDSKAHEDAKMRVLLALHRYSNSTTYEIVVGQPISRHTPEEKTAIKKMLVGTHTLTVNGVTKTFTIARCEVAAEGAAAILSNPAPGLLRVIDVGSATVNCATLLDMRYVNRDSETLPFGFNTIRNRDFHELARGIYAHVSKRWKKQNEVFLAGGVAGQLLEPIREYFPKAQLLQPIHNNQHHSPIYANAVGFYTVGRKLYEHR
ncbi:ParM/StbA family protein [Geobacillus stearothermophilus]|uniref:ParM/StbA family protein n=1 Tax=Geobacillus stearothermophilus TaxID=1422 RepID=UPI002E23C0BC|nr:ParM/StbA family protein [Geobacillus stearothermophilus]